MDLSSRSTFHIRWICPLILLLAILFTNHHIRLVTAYSSGAPNSKNVCTSLIPGHGSRQNAISPYKLIHSENVDGQIVINLVATSQVTFAGFIVQARDAENYDTIVDGEFLRSEGTQVKSCHSGKSNTWTHSSGQTKTQVSTLWIPPARFNGSVIFKGTVVQVKQAYWDQIMSEPLFMLNGYRVDQKHFTQNYNTLTNNEQGTSEPLSSSSLDYNQCSERMCLGLGDSTDCLSTRTCQAILTSKQETDTTEFMIMAKPSGDHKGKYYSVGFSHDDSMGDDLVFDCYTDSNGRVKVGMSYNHGKSNEILSGSKIIRDGIGQYTDGVIQCRWKLDRNIAINGKQYDLVDKKYYMLLAHGTVESDDGEKSYHDLRARSSETVNLASVGQLITRDMTYLIKIHGGLMVFSWMFTVSLAIIFARYFKEAWSNQLLCGVKIWFAFHRTLMVVSVIMMVIAQTSIFYYVGGYRIGIHQVLGSIAFAFALFQPLGALFRPHPDAGSRWIFNWLHWFGGNAGHITATAAILLATRLKTASLPESFLYIVMAWILFHVVMHIILQFHSSCSGNSKTSDMAMHEMRNGERMYMDKGSSSSRSGFKSFLLSIYTLVVLAITTILVLLIVIPEMVTERLPFI